MLSCARRQRAIFPNRCRRGDRKHACTRRGLRLTAPTSTVALCRCRRSAVKRIREAAEAEATELQRSRAAGLAGRAGAARHRRRQAVSGNRCPILSPSLRSPTASGPDGKKVAALRHRIGGNRHGFSHCGVVSCRAGHAHAYAQPDGLRQDAGPARARAPFLLLVVGYPADGATVPAITKKAPDEIATFVG